MDETARRIVSAVRVECLHPAHALAGGVEQVGAHITDDGLAIVVRLGTALARVGDQATLGVGKAPPIGDLFEGLRGDSGARLVGEESELDGGSLVPAAGGPDEVLVLVLVLGVVVDLVLAALAELLDLEHIVLLHALSLVLEPRLHESVEADGEVAKALLASRAGGVVAAVGGAQSVDHRRVFNAAVSVGRLLPVGTAHEFERITRQEGVQVLVGVLLEAARLVQEGGLHRGAADGGGGHRGGGRSQDEGGGELHGRLGIRLL